MDSFSSNSELGSGQQEDQPFPEYQQGEETFSESEDRFRAVWEAAADAMSLSNPDGTVIAANSAYYRLYGYAPEQVLGKNFSIIFPEEQRSWAQKLYLQMFTSPPSGVAVETPIMRSDGVERMVESRYTFLTQQGRRTAMLSIIRDITEQKRVEEALHEAHLKLHMALEMGHMVTWKWERATNMIHWSANVETAFGFALAGYDSSFDAFLEYVHPADRAFINEELQRTFAEGMDATVEFRIITPAGTLYRVKAQSQVLYDEKGQPECMIGVCQDITGEKQVEDSLA
ncbi:MAG TPA: PAS domain S-box protein [Ktedonobacteraceae bacterium]|nr:PAS domain S-box protein [Ktedonobacteraceae bacterium]